jgi:hypothetical protein
MFISGTINYNFFKRVSHKQRHLSSQAHHFKDQSIVSTLEEYMTYPDFTQVVLPPRTREWYKNTCRSLEPRSLKSLDINGDILVRSRATALAGHDPVDSLSSHMPDDFADSVAQIIALGHVIPPADADLLLDQKYRTAISALNQRPASASSPCLVCARTPLR